jgi:hypothetical protein
MDEKTTVLLPLSEEFGGDSVTLHKWYLNEDKTGAEHFTEYCEVCLGAPPTQDASSVMDSAPVGQVNESNLPTEAEIAYRERKMQELYSRVQRQSESPSAPSNKELMELARALEWAKDQVGKPYRTKRKWKVLEYETEYNPQVGYNVKVTTTQSGTVRFERLDNPDFSMDENYWDSLTF